MEVKNSEECTVHVCLMCVEARKLLESVLPALDLLADDQVIGWVEDGVFRKVRLLVRMFLKSPLHFMSVVGTKP